MHRTLDVCLLFLLLGVAACGSDTEPADDPESLPGFSGGRVRLTACALGVLWYDCYGGLRVEAP